MENRIHICKVEEFVALSKTFSNTVQKQDHKTAQMGYFRIALSLLLPFRPQLQPGLEWGTFTAGPVCAKSPA